MHVCARREGFVGTNILINMINQPPQTKISNSASEIILNILYVV
jgi:hypothetical protein